MLDDYVCPKPKKTVAEEAQLYPVSTLHETPAFYMVYVQGRRVPTIKHASYRKAMVEAARLARLPELRGTNVFVLRSECVVNHPVIENTQWGPTKVL